MKIYIYIHINSNAATGMIYTCESKLLYVTSVCIKNNFIREYTSVLAKIDAIHYTLICIACRLLTK